MAKISHYEWINTLEAAYELETGKEGHENEHEFEAWLDKKPVDELLELLHKVEQK